MHELSLCQDLLGQVTQLARQHRARAVSSVHVQIGLLAGVEPLLLEHAFNITRVGSVAAEAAWSSDSIPPRVHCQACETEADVSLSDLRCPVCGADDTRLIQGGELILARVELVVDD